MWFDDYDAVQFHNLGIVLELGDTSHALIADNWETRGSAEHQSENWIGWENDVLGLARSEGNFALACSTLA